MVKTKEKAIAINDNKTPKSVRSENKEIREPYKEKEFEMFVLWKSLPGLLIGKPEEELRKLGFVNPIILELLQIRNQAQFARRFKLRPKTLSEWNPIIEEKNLIRETRKRMFKELTSNVNTAFYRKTVQFADAARVRLWHELFEDFTPEGMMPPQQNFVQINQKIVNLGRKYDEELKKIYEEEIKNEKVSSIE